jgi:predicted nucleic-acid-binding Zn-ribbon protein
MPLPTLPLTPNAEKFVRDALAKLQLKGATQDVCPRCSHHEWQVDAVYLPAYPLPSPLYGARKPYTGLSCGYLPMLQIMCTNCGNTIFHNLKVLDTPLPTDS